MLSHALAHRLKTNHVVNPRCPFHLFVIPCRTHIFAHPSLGSLPNPPSSSQYPNDTNLFGVDLHAALPLRHDLIPSHRPTGSTRVGAVLANFSLFIYHLLGIHCILHSFVCPRPTIRSTRRRDPSWRVNPHHDVKRMRYRTSFTPPICRFDSGFAVDT